MPKNTIFALLGIRKIKVFISKNNLFLINNTRLVIFPKVFILSDNCQVNSVVWCHVEGKDIPCDNLIISISSGPVD